MQCPRCQQENPRTAKFCNACGSRLDVVCPACSHANVPGSRFCNECGRPLDGTVTTPTAKFASPESYTPKHLAEKILTSKAALEGERKQVTVLFADLKGSMELLADRDPEEARKLLDPVLERMMEAVHRYEGTVNQVMGDGIMALFGAPLAHEDHAVRACYAALDMQAAIRRYADEVWRTDGVTVKIRVGLNSGEVVVRAIGSDLRVDYTAVGQTTHLAARMEQLATPGTVLLTADTLRLAEGYVTAKPLGPVPVKGLEAPMEVYELTGAGPLRSRLHAAAARGLTRFVGRERELEQLREALARVAQGNGQVVAIVGEPGVGKSRLVWEVTHSHRVHGWLVLQAGSVSYGKATSYLPVIDLLKSYFTIEDRDDPRAMQEKVTGKLLTLDRAFETGLPGLLFLLDVPTDDPQWAALDPPQRRRRTLDAVKQLLLRESQQQPVLVVFEDLHWIDSETQALLDALVERLPATRMFLLVNYRPEYQPAWGSRTSYTQLRLDALAPGHADELLGALLGTDSALEPLKRALIARTEGNPFFLEESVRALVETGALAGERGAYRLARPLPSIRVPATVQAVLTARIDRLPPEEKRLLQTASVIGKDVPYPLLHAISELPEDDLRRSLADLEAAEFLYETRLCPDVEYTFKHALTHEVTYGSLLHDRRRVAHLRIVDAIKRLHVERLDEQIERLAHHAMRAEAWEDAVASWRRAGAKAMARSANREATTCLEQALLALGRLPESSAKVSLTIDVRFDLRNSLWPLGEYKKVLDHLHQAQALAEHHGDERRLSRALTFLTHYFFTQGDNRQALARGEAALAAASKLGDTPLEVQANLRVSQVHRAMGNYRAAVMLTRMVIESLKGVQASERLGMLVPPAVFSRTILVTCLGSLGEFSEGTVWAEEALRGAEAVGHPFTLIHAVGAAGVLYATQGDARRAIPLLEEAVSLCESGDFPVLFPASAAALGAAYTTVGRVASAIRLLEKALESALSIRMLPNHPLLLARLAEAYLLAGQPTKAKASATRALTLARKAAARGAEAAALGVLGTIASHQDQPDFRTAESHYREAMALANELGMRPLIAHCHLGLGTLYRRIGDHAKASEHLMTASTMYREMGMEFWLEKAGIQLSEST
jgi:class 3 adenylate cyclase/tetratricopeptide (TPR) repeat protein